MSTVKPLGHRAYGSIPHLPGSRMGPGDHHIHDGQAAIATAKARKGDTVIVQEKLDGSCCAVARTDDGTLVALGRAGYLAATSPFVQHHLFADWVQAEAERFAWLEPGHRVVGEWLAQAHGTRYDLPHEPFVVFDWMAGAKRMPYYLTQVAADRCGLASPHAVSVGGPVSIDDAMAAVEPSHHGAIDPVEGAVWRVERAGVVDFLAKYVRPDKVDGCYLPELTGGDPVWNWAPASALDGAT